MVIFCRDAGPVQLVWSNLPVQAHLETAGRGGQMWIDPASIRVGADARGIARVLREHGLGQAPVGVLGTGTFAPWHPGPPERYPPWQDVLTLLPHVRFKPVGRTFLLATVCLSQEELAVVRYCAAAETRRRGRWRRLPRWG